MRKIIWLFVVAVVTAGVWACNPDTGNSKKITIAYVNWAEGVAMTQLAKVMLEDQGYTVTLKNADVAPVFAAVAGGDADVFMDTWLPVTHHSYMETFGDKLTILGIDYENAKIGLVVSDNSPVSSIAELNANKALFDGKIVGIDAGAGIMGKAEAAIKEYGLKYELQSSSEAAMMATVKKKMDAGEPVLVTGWAPHWMFAKYKLRFLEDPKKVFGETEQLNIIANKAFVEHDAAAVSFFSKFKLNDQQLSSLMAALLDADGQETAAVRKWMTANQELVNSLLPAVQQ
ncbi:glycine betaine ABC transporter substrate-binding protein [Chitinophaga defluvii]|uniref:Glycine betaine ABC transporter substrate-binding protein n=1 Tax=Chitinophaga defluvii TaxID=3163343 RepID=A0ABV2T5Q9_9BACT